MSLALPCSCKLCGKVIGHFAMEWPPPTETAAATYNQQETARFWKALSEHMQKERAQPKHTQALAVAADLGGNVTLLFLSRHFSLPAAAEGYVEVLRQRLHGMTLRVRMTDADLLDIEDAIIESADEMQRNEVYESYDGAIGAAILQGLKKIRDAYEGAPAPAQPETAGEQKK